MKKTTIHQLWEYYRVKVLTLGASPIQVRECQQAFYAGIASIMGEMFKIGTPDFTEEEGEQIVQEYMDELTFYVEAFKLRHGITTFSH